jgi:pyruvate/2-oxoglutarate/acetoin dehydrogenase E1 component
MLEIPVELGPRRYVISVGHGIAGSLPDLLEPLRGRRTVVVASRRVWGRHRKALERPLRALGPLAVCQVPDGEHLVPFGRAAVARAGSDVTVIGIAVMVQRALAAAEVLAREGVSVEVIDPRTLAPLDLDTILASVQKTGRLLIADESYRPCGIGAEIAAQVADRGFDDLDAPIRRINGLHTPIPYSPPLEKAVVPDVDAVVRAVRDLRAE